MKHKPGVLIGVDWQESIASMPDKDAGQLVKALLAEAAGLGAVPPVSKIALVLWPKLLALQVSNRDNYADVCAKRQAAIEKRWAEQRKKDGKAVQSELNEIQPATTPIQNDTNVSGSKHNTNPNHNTKVTKVTVSPYSPPEGKKDRSGIVGKWLKRGIGLQYKRRAGTAWSEKEVRKLVEIAKRPEALREWQAIRRLYRSGYEYYRRDIITLMNNWTGELDRANRTITPGKEEETVRSKTGKQLAALW